MTARLQFDQRQPRPINKLPKNKRGECKATSDEKMNCISWLRRRRDNSKEDSKKNAQRSHIQTNKKDQRWNMPARAGGRIV
ncbi:MAG: hypothetical protein COA41_05695 [Sphingopyxis sp.]|nr:MAG: hypothetical protein COA41_05695 [Sphingopyxis sp.]